MSESALDRVLSSYSSSIKVLLYTHRNRKKRDPKEPGNSILLASVQNADDQNLLEHVGDEVEALAKVLPGDLKPILLSEPDKQDILSRLLSCAVFHFAGHGISDPLDPSESCLLVKDWNKIPASALSVKDLIGFNLYVQSPWLAYLSACSTGETKDDRLYHESIHLMSGCQLAGFQHAVGSLWEISDRYSVDVAREVYTVIKLEIGTLGNVAYAVHQALRYLRDLSLLMGIKRKIGSETAATDSTNVTERWNDL
jgi:CHAT domain-containing protein